MKLSRCSIRVPEASIEAGETKGLMMLAIEMLSEPVAIPDIYVSGLSHMEKAGDGDWRLVFYARHGSPYGGEDFVIVCRMVAPTSAILDGVKTVLRTLGKRCCGAVSGLMN